MVFIFVNVHLPPLTLGCKNKKQPFGPIELDFEAGNLVILFLVTSASLNSDQKIIFRFYLCLIYAGRNKMIFSNQAWMGLQW